MNFVGKYIFTMPTPSGERENTFLLRNYYTGELHGTLLDGHGGVQLAQNIVTDGDKLTFTAKAYAHDVLVSAGRYEHIHPRGVV